MSTPPTSIRSHNLGFPRIGANRELKRALESTWAGKSSPADLLDTARRLRAENWRLQQTIGIDLIPSNDFSLYDQMLDTCLLVGAVPPRFTPPRRGRGPAHLFRHGPRRGQWLHPRAGNDQVV